MGRGNVCIRGNYEGLYYIDYDNFETYVLDEHENETDERDYDAERYLLEADIERLKSLLKTRFSSLSDCDMWIDRNTKALLENNLFYIATEDNEWSMAIKLLQKEDCYGLQAGQFQNYLKGLEECLFELYPTVGCYGGAWTSGKIKRPDGWKSISKLWRTVE